MEIKRSILLKFEPAENLSLLFNNYGFYVEKTLNHINNIYTAYDKISPIETKCEGCGETKNAYYQKGSEKFCTNCFSRTWSEYTLFKIWKPELLKLQPKLAEHQGYYYGSISTAVKIFKSYLRKKEQRDYQTAKAKENCIVINGRINDTNFNIKKTKSEINQGKNLTKELVKLEREKENLGREFKGEMRRATRKPISFPHFRNCEIYFGKQGMFEFKKGDNGYDLLISDYKALRSKISCPLIIGSLEKRHKKCGGKVEFENGLYRCTKCGEIPRKECFINHQEQFILKCIEKEEHKIVYPKTIRRKKGKEYEYYFVFPTRDVVNVETSKEALEKKMKQPDTTLCLISFGIKKPATMVAMNLNKILAVKNFGDGKLYQRCEFERKLKSDIYNAIASRYEHEHSINGTSKKDKKLHQKKRKALKKITEKIGFRLLKFVNYYNQNLTTEIVNYAKTFNNPILVFRETKNIKDISYKGELMRRLSRWSLEQEKSFLEYKSYLNEIPIYKVPYKDASIVTCSKCGEATKEKATTQLLKLETRFKCQKCDYQQDFQTNDAISLKIAIGKKVKA